MSEPVLGPWPKMASLFQRFLGQLIDGLVMTAPILPGAILLWTHRRGWMALVGALVWTVLYGLFADGLPNGQSLGKKLLGIAVIDVRTGKPCSFAQSMVRNMMLSVVGLVDWLFVFGERRQRLGDRAAGTIVIRKRRGRWGGRLSSGTQIRTR